jgi:hypothetical protein
MHANEKAAAMDGNDYPGAHAPTVTLGAMKDLLHRFSWERRGWDRDAAAAEFGALVLYVIQQADRLGIDLVTAGETHLKRVAETQPALVPEAPRR